MIPFTKKGKVKGHALLLRLATALISDSVSIESLVGQSPLPRDTTFDNTSFISLAVA